MRAVDDETPPHAIARARKLLRMAVQVLEQVLYSLER